MTGMRFAAAAVLTSLLVGCASDYGGRISGGNDALSPEERRLQNVESRVATLSRRLDAANLNGADEQNQRTRQDLSALRGDVEKLRYDLTQLQQKNSDLALRVQKLEAAAQSNPAGQVYGYGTGGAVAAPSYGAPVVPAAPAGSAPMVAPPAAPGTLPPTHADAAAFPPAAPSTAVTAPPAVAPSAPPAAMPPASPAATAPGEEAAYQAASDALMNGKYDDALRGFRAQLEQWPNGKFADAALYWSGEAFYVKSDYKSAQGAFQGLLQRFPQSVKAPDAMLKLGLTQMELKQTADGRATLQKVVRSYPNTNAARLAQQRLDSAK